MMNVAATAVADAKTPAAPIDRAAVLAWYTGKALANATAALDVLQQSAAAGSWLPKVSRKVMAALSKPNVAAKFADANRDALDAINHYRRDNNFKRPHTECGTRIAIDLRYGAFQAVQTMNWPALEAGCQSDAERAALAVARKFAADFAPVAALVTKLDATRPLPVFTSLGLSPTVTATLASIGVEGTPATLRVCPIEWIQVQDTDPETGKITFRYVGRLLWPENTRHDTSRHAHGNGAHQQCHACGHAIKNGYNWVPLLVDDAAGTPRSLWVGRDCARNLFGVAVTGDVVELEGR